MREGTDLTFVWEVKGLWVIKYFVVNQVVLIASFLIILWHYTYMLFHWFIIIRILPLQPLSIATHPFPVWCSATCSSVRAVVAVVYPWDCLFHTLSVYFTHWVFVSHTETVYFTHLVFISHTETVYFTHLFALKTRFLGAKTVSTFILTNHLDLKRFIPFDNLFPSLSVWIGNWFFVVHFRTRIQKSWKFCVWGLCMYALFL